MTENELIEHGFKKIEVPDKESDNGYDYYYYILELCEGVSLVSDDSDNIKDNNWSVICFEILALKIVNKNDLINFLEVMRTVIDCDNV